MKINLAALRAKASNGGLDPAELAALLDLAERKSSNHNRGSVDGKRSGAWRTPPPLFRALQAHFGVTCVLDAAASPENALCLRYLTKEDNTLRMGPAAIRAAFDEGFARHQERTVHPLRPAVWTNPDYNNADEMLRWIEVGSSFAMTHRIPWLFLVPSSRSEQPWWQLAMNMAPYICNPEGRVYYYDEEGVPSDGANHPSAALLFTGDPIVGRQVTTLPQPWQADNKYLRTVAAMKKKEQV